MLQAGEIPKEGALLAFSGYDFLVLAVEDDRRILTLQAAKRGSGLLGPTSPLPPLSELGDPAADSANRNSGDKD